MEELIYLQAAKTWTEALPLGNGRMAAMHFGGVEKERFQLNEDTLWSGPPGERDKEFDHRGIVRKVRQLIEEEKYQEADNETKNMFGYFTEAYMPLGDLNLQFLHGNVAKNYERKLDIEKALSTVKYTVGKTDFKREAFISHPHQVQVIRLTSSVPKMLNAQITLDSLLKYRNQNDDDQIVIQGILPESNIPHYYEDENDLPIYYGEFEETDAVHFEGRVGVKLTDGESQISNGKLAISNATEAVIYFASASSFNGFNQMPGKDFTVLAEKNKTTLEEAMALSYDEIKEAHITDYQSLYKRVEFELKTRWPIDERDTARRLKQHGSKDLKMNELLFQYGRYLLIASSRAGTQPANLQGVWNGETRAPWSSNYTLNINTEMNYWPAETTNLAECHEPLLTMVEELAVTGEKMVREKYGLKGWTAHHNTDGWRHAHPVGRNRTGDAIWAYWPMSGPWLVRHLWEHYEYSLDKDYLKEVYPTMKGSVEFCLDWLVEDDSGYLVTSPSTSPEHLFFTKDGQVGSVTKGATMDLQIMWDLFTNFIEASTVLGEDDEMIERVKTAKDRLHPMQIGRRGQLQEWLDDFRGAERHHRHVSHLYGLYPANQIKDEKLLDAIKQTLNLRGDDGTGWSLGWKMNLWARLKDGERIKALLEQLFNIVDDSRAMMAGGGVYPNLLGAHPPFQIDGNFSYTAGVVEAIVQSHDGYVELLPALPSNWITGKLTGIRVRNGFEVGLTWESMQMKELTVLSTAGQAFVLKTNDAVSMTKEGEKKSRLEPVDGLITISTKEKDRFILSFVK